MKSLPLFTYSWSFKKLREVGRRDRSRPNYKRKLFHFFSGVFCFILYAFFLTRAQALWLLCVVGGGILSLDVLRFYFPKMRNLSLQLFGTIMRKEEMKRLTGSSYYILGLAVVAFLFPKSIVLLAILYLAVGDPISSFFGTQWGTTKVFSGKKSLEGAVANAVASCLVTAFYAISFLHLDSDKALVLTVLGTGISVFSEMLPIKIDDNFVIPVLSATLLSLFDKYFLFF